MWNITTWGNYKGLVKAFKQGLGRPLEDEEKAFIKWLSEKL